MGGYMKSLKILEVVLIIIKKDFINYQNIY